MLRAVIMAGGSGTRFWPLSRQRTPKQFLKLYGSRSLLQQAVDRIESLVGVGGVMVITNHQQVDKTQEQLPRLGKDHIIGEPAGRDTAACIGLAAALLLRADPEARMIVLAADHIIGSTEAFHAAVRTADRFVEEHPEALVTFGIPPTGPATGYGYLRRGDLAGAASEVPIHKLQSFHEKPNLAKAEEFLASGEYFWNSGIFCWKAATILTEIERCAPDLAAAVERIADAWGSPDRERVFSSEYEKLTKISIDFAVMERAKTVYMVEAPFPWDDVGSWLALERVLEPNAAGNVIIGKQSGLTTRNCVIVGNDDHLIATIGVEDLIIVHTPDATLVARKDDEQAVKQLLAKLQMEGGDQYL